MAIPKTEAEIVYWAVEQFTFAAKFLACCLKKKVDVSMFEPKTILTVDDGSIIKIAEWPKMNQSKLENGAKNQLMTSIAACSIAVDDALSRRYGGSSSYRNWKAKPSSINSLREIIFLIRSAYAHKMPDVHWHISSNRRGAIYTVTTPDGEVEFDANDRHGTKMNPVHFGGLKGYFRLVNYASDLLT